MSAVLGTPGGIATIAAGFVRFASYLLPQLDRPWVTGHVGHLAYTLHAAQPLAALVVICVTALNYLSVRFGGSLQFFLGSIKIGTIIVIIVAAALWSGQGTAQPGAALIMHDTTAIGAVLTAMVPVMWAYNGLQNIGYLGAEIRDPARSIPVALLCGLLIVGTLYVLLDVMYCHVLPFSRVAASAHVASDTVESLFGRSGAAWLTVAMGISALATLHAVVPSTNRGSRMPWRVRDFSSRSPPACSRVTAAPKAPCSSWGTLGALIALTGTFEELVSLSTFSPSGSFSRSAPRAHQAARDGADLPRPYRVWGHPWTPLLFLIAVLALTINLWLDQPIRSVCWLAHHLGRPALLLRRGAAGNQR